MSATQSDGPFSTSFPNTGRNGVRPFHATWKQVTFKWLGETVIVEEEHGDGRSDM